jgi:hypothetical protein
LRVARLEGVGRIAARASAERTSPTLFRSLAAISLTAAKTSSSMARVVRIFGSFRENITHQSSYITFDINATLDFPALAPKVGIHVKTLHPMFGPKGSPTASNLFNIIACLQEHEEVRLRVVV